MLAQRFERGKIDFYIGTEMTGEIPGFSINRLLAKKCIDEVKSLAAELHEDCPSDLLSMVLKMPEVQQTGRDDPDEQEWTSIMPAIDQALALADTFRINEGKVLEEDILKHVHQILNLLETTRPHERRRILDLRERLLRDFSKYSGDFNGSAPDQNRFEQELIYYLEKLDITEEMVRLRKHCDYFLETLLEEGSQGKKLGFVTQEIGREINTIGSKASDAEIQKIAVQMKDELEKIREQLGNIL